MHEGKKLTTASGTLVAVEARRAFVQVDDPDAAGRRFALSMNGEPVAPMKATVHRGRAVRGLNLLVDQTVEGRPPLWQPIDSTRVTIGRAPAGKWGLDDGTTQFVQVAPDTRAAIEYASPAGHALLRLASGEDYAFEGYFATHRCNASVQIDLIGQSGALLTTLSKEVPKASGGATLDRYAKVVFIFHAPSTTQAARVRLSIDGYKAPPEGREDAFLFFAHLSLALTGDGSVHWQPLDLTSDQVAALSEGGSLVDLALPAAPLGATPTVIEVTDMATGEPVGHLQLALPLPSGLEFRPASFDGVTLTGTILGEGGEHELELAIDGIVAGRLSVSASSRESREVKIRVPDGFLDGAPHAVELRERQSGKPLFSNALLLKALITPWETLQDYGRLPLPLDLHPMARRRYASLVAHFDAIASRADTGSDETLLRTEQAARAHQVLSPLPRERALVRPKLAVRSPLDPEVSVVLGTSDLDAAYRTIAGLILAFNNTSWEIVVATDDTPDSVARLTELVSGVRVERCRSRAGRAVLLNTAVKCAKGRYLAFLDAGSEPSSHWLDELHLSFTLFDNIGVAAAKVITPSGRLVAVGGQLLSSGAPQPITGAGNPEHPSVAHARHIDYAPLHAAMIPRAAYAAVGGLSNEFGSSALEDADLALRLRADGLSVICAPTSTVTMHRRVTHRAAPPESMVAFKRKWAHVYQPAPIETLALDEVRERDIAGRVLFIDQQTPRTDIDAGSYAAAQEIRLFQALGYKVSFLPLNLTHLGTYTRALQRIGVEVIHAPFVLSVDDLLRRRGDVFDLVYVTRYQVARLALPSVRRWCPRTKVIFNNADLHFLRELRSALAQKNAELLRRSTLTREAELDIIRQADLTLSYSDAEHAVILSHNLDQGRVAKAPWVVPEGGNGSRFAECRDIAFIGSFGHAPNVEAVQFFASRVMPLLRTTLAGVRFMIYGSQMTEDIRGLEADDIVAVGHVEDVSSVFGTARIFAAPLISGAGLKGKVLEAMAYGVPSVLSPVAAEGVGAQADVHYLAAGTPQEWATQIAALYTDECRWTAMAQQAQAFVRREYSVERGIGLLRRALEMIDVFPPQHPTALQYRAPLPPLI